LLAHLAQLVLHAGPDAAQVDRVYAVEGLGRFVGGVGRRGLDAGVVERVVESAEGRHCAFDKRGHLLLVGHVADDAERLLARRGQLRRRAPEGLLVAVGEHDGGPGLGERLRSGEPHAGAGPGDHGNAAVKVVGRVHAIARASARPG
jgi:hypothetical protein